MNQTCKDALNKPLYYNPYEVNGIIYSCDMVRYDFSASTEKLQRFTDRFNWNPDVTHYDNVNMWHYRHLFTVPCGASSVSIGIGFNGTKDMQGKSFIEFNPNKCGQEAINLLHEMELTVEKPLRATRFDFAMDIPSDRSLFSLHKDERSYTKYDNGGITETLGIRNKGGYFKLYDKTKESGLLSTWTRLELTIDANNPTLSDFPTVYCIPDLQETLPLDASLKPTDLVLLNCLQYVPLTERESIVKPLDSRKRKKLLAYFNYQKVTPDRHGFSHVLTEVSNRFND